MTEHPPRPRPALDADVLNSTRPGDATMEYAVTAYTELATIILGAQSISAVLSRLAELARALIPGADEVSITLIERGRARTVGFAGTLATVLDERQYTCARGPCLDAAVTGTTIAIDDTAADTRYPEFSRQAHRHGIRHTLSVAIPAFQATTAALNIYGNGDTGPFTDRARDVADGFAGYASIALANAALYAVAVQEVAQMKTAMASRAVIEQAKGVIIRDRACSPEEAFDILRDASSRANRKLRDVAQSLVTSATNRTRPRP